MPEDPDDLDEIGEIPPEGDFLGLPAWLCRKEAARVEVVPAPYEAGVSYGGGAARGPAALIAASRQVELYDRGLGTEPVRRYGVHTGPALAFAPDEPPASVLGRLAERTAAAAAAGRFPLVLGGDHSLSPGAFAGIALARPGDAFDIVHLDAHADLRDRYGGSPHSHACAARRLLEHPACGKIWQLGVRSLGAGEAAFLRSRPGRLRTWFAEDLSGDAWRRELAEGLAGKRVYLTLDVDAFDPAVVPGTGTPEPDGLSWRLGLEIGELVARAAERVVGMDVVEAAPVPGLHYSEFNVAKLLYLWLNRFIRLPPPGK
ncbi:MAG: arginase family protein [Planctomycetota bacterium]|jgi:agmatinase|nr:arginase family protein [Planctomycetota bacterium]